MILKKSLWLMITIVVLIFFTSCNNSTNEGIAPELPPLESMVIDFDDFNDAHTKSANDIKSEQIALDNWEYSRVVVGVWNLALASTLAVPVASFRSAFSHQAEHLGGLKWQWAYTIDGFTSQYSARLSGEIIGSEVHWEMYVAKNGIDAFEEFLWFSGVSKTDGKSGYWLLNHSSAFPENMLRIDWTVENEEVGNITYKYVRELNNDRKTDMFKDSYMTYGLQTGDLDAFYDVHIYDFNLNSFVDVDIEWSRTNYNGKVKALNYFETSDWHCWDTNGDNIDCP